MAQINYDLGVSATFFVLLRSPIYNVLAQKGIKYLEKIRNLEQRVGFHYYLSSKRNSHNLGNSIRKDYQFLKDNFDYLDPVVTLHDPGQANKEKLTKFKKLHTPDLTLLPGDSYFEQLPYYSDSLLRHTPREFKEIIKSGNESKIQLLFHPFNWITEAKEGMINILAETWQHIIRYCEEDVKNNRDYEDTFPSGMPDEILTNFTRELIRARRNEKR